MSQTVYAAYTGRYGAKLMTYELLTPQEASALRVQPSPEGDCIIKDENGHRATGNRDRLYDSPLEAINAHLKSELDRLETYQSKVDGIRQGINGLIELATDAMKEAD